MISPLLIEQLEALELEKTIMLRLLGEESYALQDQINVLKAELASKQDKIQRKLTGIMANIANIKQEIINTWEPGSQKTFKYPEGTLKLRTTSSIEILDPGAVMHALQLQLSEAHIAEQYVSFKKPAVKKFIAVHPVSNTVVKTIEQTSVSWTPTKKVQ